MVPLPTLDALDGLAIPAACPVPWDSMRGGARTRFCDQCSQNVHDVSELTRAEALRLVAPGREVPCLRISCHDRGLCDEARAGLEVAARQVPVGGGRLRAGHLRGVQPGLHHR